MIDTAKIAKNTVYLYIRMILVLGAQFYLVRLLLSALGVEDFGIFNLISGFAAFFTLFNSALQATVQRFLCYELGKNDVEQAKKVYSACLILFGILAISIFAFSETLGLWMVRRKLNIPEDRVFAALVVYQFCILVTIFKTIQIPFAALIIAYERFNIFVRISLLEVGLSLAAVLALKFIPFSSLIVYSLFYTVAIGGCLLAYIIHCRCSFKVARFVRVTDIKLFKQLGAFFSWNVFGSVSGVMNQQGVNVLINIFFGVIYNATWALSSKLGLAVLQVLGGFQAAYDPQIIKAWSVRDYEGFANLVITASKLSFFLMLICTLPLLLFTDFFLGLWLTGEIPPRLVQFVQIVTIGMILHALVAPFETAVQATGKIAHFNILTVLLSALVLCSTYSLYRVGSSVVMPLMLVSGLPPLRLTYCLWYFHHRHNFPIGRYIMRALSPILPVVTLTTVCMFLHPIAACAACPIAFWLIGVTRSEKEVVRRTIISKVKSK